MPKYRVEVVEKATTVREAWFEAESEDDARHQAESEDWREWSAVDSSASLWIEHIEET